VFKSRRAREIILLAIGVTTPVGILMVNGAAFVMRHLVEFRYGIAAFALLSSLILNGLTAYVLLRLASRYAADFFAEYRRWAVAVAVLAVLVTSGFAAYFTYTGMQDPRKLPDPGVVLWTLFFLAMPFVLSFVGRRLAGLRGVPAPIDEEERNSEPLRPPAAPSPPTPSRRRIRG
jgi:hypothetical protein